MANKSQLQPDDQFPKEALQQSVQVHPKDTEGNFTFTFNLASAADLISPWGRSVQLRDRQLRDFWPSEDYLAGAVSNVGFRHAALEWEIRGGTERVNKAVSDVLVSAIAGDTYGWVPFMLKFSQDLCTQDNGAFIELIRDPVSDAGSRFKGAVAPVLGIGHLDANRCVRTGNPEYPVKYTDRNGEIHKLRWYEVIPFSDQPSAIETMNGVGYCAVTRVLRRAQISKSIALFKDEKISGRHYKQIHFVSGVSRQDIKDEMLRGQEEANNTGLLRFIQPAILASLDPEKPVSTATIDLASLPDGFDFDEDMKWYISGLALGFGVDYQEFAPLPGGNIGSSQQSMILHRKGTGKGPAVFMRMLSDAFRNYGVLPRGVEMRFNDKDEQEEMERQTVRTKALEEGAIAIRNYVLTPEAVRQDLVRRGLYTEETVEGIPPEYGIRQMDKNQNKNPVGQKGGNTMVEDAGRNETGKPNETVGDRLRKAFSKINTLVKKEEKPKEKDIIVNVPEPLPPLVKVMVPKLTGAEQVIKRDLWGIAKTETTMTYNGYVTTSGGKDDLLNPPQTGSTVENKDGQIVINVPQAKRQVINIRMPKILKEEMEIVRDEKMNIEQTRKKIIYEEE